MHRSRGAQMSQTQNKKSETNAIPEEPNRANRKHDGPIRQPCAQSEAKKRINVACDQTLEHRNLNWVPRRDFASEVVVDGLG